MPFVLFLMFCGALVGYSAYAYFNLNITKTSALLSGAIGGLIGGFGLKFLMGGFGALLGGLIGGFLIIMTIHFFNSSK